jgi:hypothetical protein
MTIFCDNIFHWKTGFPRKTCLFSCCLIFLESTISGHKIVTVFLLLAQNWRLHLEHPVELTKSLWSFYCLPVICFYYFLFTFCILQFYCDRIRWGFIHPAQIFLVFLKPKSSSLMSLNYWHFSAIVSSYIACVSDSLCCYFL